MKPALNQFSESLLKECNKFHPVTGWCKVYAHRRIYFIDNVPVAVATRKFDGEQSWIVNTHDSGFQSDDLLSAAAIITEKFSPPVIVEEDRSELEYQSKIDALLR